MFLDICSPFLPECTANFAILLSAIFGTILVIYSQFIEAEHKRDVIRMIGAVGLFVYAFFIADKIFMITMAGIFFASLIEFVEILLGVHKHKKNIK